MSEPMGRWSAHRSCRRRPCDAFDERILRADNRPAEATSSTPFQPVAWSAVSVTTHRRGRPIFRIAPPADFPALRTDRSSRRPGATVSRGYFSAKGRRCAIAAVPPWPGTDAAL